MATHRIHAHTRTVSIIRLLRALGPLPARHRVPPQQQPDLIRAGYYHALLPFVHRSQKFFHDERPEIVRMLVDDRREQAAARGDADEPTGPITPRGARAKEMVARAARRAADAFRPHELEATARKFGKATDAWSREQLDRQVRAAMGVSLAQVEKPVTDKLEGFAKTNVELIKTVDERYFDRLQSDVQEAFSSGMTPETFADQLIDRDGMGENDARRIARDQIGKLNAQFNQERQEAMGVTGYTWRGVMDNRERDEHRELEGKHFDWDDPPESGTNGESLPPGEPIQCRCYAEPDFSAILGEAGDD